MPILGKDGSSPKHYVRTALNEVFINQSLAWDLYFTAALCYVYFLSQAKTRTKLRTTFGWWGKHARSGEDLSFVAPIRLPQEAANKRWRSTMSPCFILADSPISLIIMNQWKENLLKRKPFIYAAQTLMLVFREQLREPLQPPILYDLLRMNSSVWRHYVCICFIFSAWILNV